MKNKKKSQASLLLSNIFYTLVFLMVITFLPPFGILTLFLVLGKHWIGLFIMLSWPIIMMIIATLYGVELDPHDVNEKPSRCIFGREHIE